MEYQSFHHGHVVAIRKHIFSGKTKYQKVDIIDTYQFGLCLVLDGKMQSSSSDEWIYHECLVQPVMVTHPRPENVLIIGGGEGATLREVLKHPSVKKAVMVDIDEELIELCKEHLKSFHQGSFYSEKVELKFTDGRRFVENCPAGTFDVVILDATDPLEGGPAIYLYTKEFYTHVKRILKDDGLMVTQSGATHYQEFCFSSIARTVAEAFPVMRLCIEHIPSFLSTWSFTVGSKKYDPLALTKEEIRRRIFERKLELKFYDEDVHFRLFTLPRHVKELIQKGQICTDANPIRLKI